LGTHCEPREPDGNPLPPLKVKRAKKKGTVSAAEPSNWLHEISISKTVCHHFCPGLMAGAEIWGH
jgi:hypothetical protein